MCTRPRQSGIAVILAWIVLFWWIRYCRCGASDVAVPCNLIADGRELLCRGADLLSLEPIYDVDPLKAIVPVNITKIDLTNNNITDIPIYAFHQFSNLEILFLRRNHIRAIHSNAFINLTNLRILELDENYLIKIPTAVVNLPSLEELSISNNKIEQLTTDALHHASNLVSLDLRGNPIKKIHNDTFQNLGKLRKLILSNLKELRLFPNLNGAVSLEVLKLDRSQLKEVPFNLCQQCPKLKSLDIKSNSLIKIPDLRNCNELRVLDLASNMISTLPDGAFKGLNMLHDLLLSNNNLHSISGDTFTGLSRLQVL